MHALEAVLTAMAVSVTPPRMGRKPLNVKGTQVRLALGVPKRIDALLGKNRRAEFIREAVEEVLSRRESEKAKAARAKTKPSD